MFSFILHHLFKALIRITTLYNKFILTIPIVFFEILFQHFFNQNNEFIFKVLTSFSKRKTTTKKLVKLVFPFCSCHQ